MADVCLLGTVGTIPRVDRYLSSALFRHNGRSILFDCGEGTQLAIKKAGFSFKSIDVICLSHFHADHVTGLVGLLLTMGNEGRTEPVTVITPIGGTHILRSILIIADLAFELDVIEIDPSHDRENAVVTICDGNLSVYAACATHSVPCIAFSVYVRRDGKFDPERARALGIPQNQWNEIRKKGCTEYGGRIYYPDDVMSNERRGIKVSYVTDTRPSENLEKLVKGSDLLICEGMFGDEEKRHRAEKSGHMLFSEAATLAKHAKCDRLILTHFSPSMPEPEELLQNATDIFENTVCGTDGMTVTVNFINE
ncbi:MAG: ribonuclease Z [Clostridia bacterium]|nr:ribonuclease Z [Clostridia bacterium]